MMVNLGHRVLPPEATMTFVLRPESFGGGRVGAARLPPRCMNLITDLMALIDDPFSIQFSTHNISRRLGIDEPFNPILNA